MVAERVAGTRPIDAGGGDVTATWKPAQPREKHDASGLEWFAWGSGSLAVLLLLTGTIRLWQMGDMPAEVGVPYLGSALAIMLLGVASTVVSAASSVVVAVSRRTGS
jgi:uncharacterized membrane protein